MKFKIEDFIRKHQKSVLFSGNGENLEEYNAVMRNAAKPCTDHLGNKFDSYSAMCSYHGVDANIFYYRKNKLKLPIENAYLRLNLNTDIPKSYNLL